MILTNLFDMDKKTVLIKCNAKKTNRRGFKRKVVTLSESESNWTNTWKEEVKKHVNFRTEFILYRSEKGYLLQIKGVSDFPAEFPTKYRVVLFTTPEDFMEKIEDKKNYNIYLSDPVLALLDDVFDSEYLTRFEKDRWEEVLVDSE